LYIEPGSPWENGYCESFNSKLRDEFLNGEIFYSMKELRVLAENDLTYSAAWALAKSPSFLKRFLEATLASLPISTPW
jgi:transposase InsO family protein